MSRIPVKKYKYMRQEIMRTKVEADEKFVRQKGVEIMKKIR